MARASRFQSRFMQSIGERLEEARKRKGISIREAAEGTKIRGDYLHKFESNQFDLKLPEIYVRGFLRLYAQYLKLPADKIQQDYLALGHGIDPRGNHRVINRENYGRMEINTGKHPVAAEPTARHGTADPHPGLGKPIATGPGALPVPPRDRFQPRMPLGGVDRAALSRYGLWAGAGLLALLVLGWGLYLLLRTPAAPESSERPRPAAQAGGGNPPVEPPVGAASNPALDENVYIIALRPLRLTSAKEVGSNVELLRAPVELAAGQRHALPNRVMIVQATDRGALQIQFKGQIFNPQASGAGAFGPLNFTGQR